MKEAEKIYLDSTDKNSQNTDTFMTTLDSVSSNVKGFVRISKKSDSTTFLLCQISDLTDGTGWWTINISNQSGSSNIPFTNGDTISVSFLTNGNKGEQGPQGPTGFQG